MKSADRLKHWEDFMASINESCSTQDSKLTPREHLLHAKGQEYESHKQQLRLQRDKEQLSKSPFRPKINSKFESKEKVENRLIRYGQVSESKLENIRKEKLKNEEISLVQPLKIAETQNYVERLYTKQKLAERKLENQRMEKIEQESSSVKSPKICKKSEELVKKMERTEKIEDRLISSAKNFNEKVRAQQYIQNFSAFCSAKPKITDFAKNLNREGNVTDRLLRYKDYYNSHLKELENQYKPTPSVSPKRSNSTARERLLKPKSTKEPQESHSFRPSISPSSERIAKNLISSSERLLKVPVPEAKVYEEPDCYFQPVINEKSKKFDNRKHSGERWQGLYKMKDSIRENKEKLAKSFKVDDPECTFKPNIQKKPDRGQDQVIERLASWKEEASAKAAAKKKMIIQDELKECTFSPEINGSKNLLEISPRECKKNYAYSKRFQEVSAGEFLTKLEELHYMLHSDR